MSDINLNLVSENNSFAGTGGISFENNSFNFIPAFKDIRTGRVETSKFKNGKNAPFHMLDGLPDEWVLQRCSSGKALKIKQSIISGFIREGAFFTRQEAATFVEKQA